MCQCCNLAPASAPRSVNGWPTNAPGATPIISFRRRQQKPVQDFPNDYLCLQGSANLCFPEDRSWFQGTITTDDDNIYSLYGERLSKSGKGFVSADVPASGTGRRLSIPLNRSGQIQCSEDCYNVTLLDHFTGQTYQLPQMVARKRANSKSVHLFKSKCGSVTFTVQNISRGQKALVELKKLLGNTEGINEKFYLYGGEIYVSI